MNKLFGYFLTLVTIAWVFFWIATIYMEWSTASQLTFNELGDFMAGVFSPLAFLWLIFGYFQQNAELQSSSKALNLQAKSLNSSVKHQAEMLELTKETMEQQKQAYEKQNNDYLRRIQPVFMFQYKSSKGEKTSAALHPTIRIIKNTATKIHIVFSAAGEVVEQKMPILPPETEITLSHIKVLQTQLEGAMHIKYEDLDNNERFIAFVINKSGEAILVNSPI